MPIPPLRVRGSAMSETTLSFVSDKSQGREKPFSFRALGDLQFNFERSQCDFVVWVSSLKQKLEVAKEEKELFIKKLVAEFFKAQLGVNIASDFFAPRPEPLYSASVFPIENHFVLYGVDFLSTAMIRYMFQPLQLKVKWMSDSACMLFASEEEAEGVFEHLLDPLDYDLAEPNGDYPYRGWYRLRPYYIFGNRRALLLRFATTNDLEVHRKQSINKYGHYEAIVKAMPRYFLQKFDALDIYWQKMKRKQARRQEERRMFEAGYYYNLNMNFWDTQQDYTALDQSICYNIAEDYRFNEQDSSEEDLSYAARQTSRDFNDAGSYCSIVAGESLLLGLQDQGQAEYPSLMPPYEQSQQPSYEQYFQALEEGSFNEELTEE